MDTTLRTQIELARRHVARPLALVAVVAVLSAGVALLLPKWYKARTTLLPPTEGTNPYGALASLIESSALGKVGLVATSSPSDTYVEILKSRTVREAVIRSFDLQRRYKEKNLDLCLKLFDSHIRVGVLQSRAIELTVEDQDPNVAAQLANALITQLDTLNIHLQQEKGARTGEFLETQMLDVGTRLRTAEARLTAYERAHGVFAGPEQAGIAGVADLVSSRLALQVRRTWLASYSPEDSPALKALDSEIAAIDQNVARLPGLKQEGARLALDVEIQRRVYTLITAQVEEARMRSHGGLSTVSVLDPARPPTLRSRPSRALIVLVSTAVAALLAGAWLYWRVRQDLAQVSVRGG
jgi:tyrosine-protein kinase Etk/Wzc